MRMDFEYIKEGFYVTFMLMSQNSYTFQSEYGNIIEDKL